MKFEDMGELVLVVEVVVRVNGEKNVTPSF